MPVHRFLCGGITYSLFFPKISMPPRPTPSRTSPFWRCSRRFLHLQFYRLRLQTFFFSLVLDYPADGAGSDDGVFNLPLSHFHALSAPFFPSVFRDGDLAPLARGKILPPLFPFVLFRRPGRLDLFFCSLGPFLLPFALVLFRPCFALMIGGASALIFFLARQLR